MTTHEPDPYRILGVDRDASLLEIARARRRLAKRYHPDVTPEAWAAERMQKVNDAWQLLADPMSRLAWDRGHPIAGAAAAWAAWPQAAPPPYRHGQAVAQSGGNGWWWTSSESSSCCW